MSVRERKHRLKKNPKRLLEESIKRPATADNILNPELNCIIDAKIQAKFIGSYLKKEKEEKVLGYFSLLFMK